MLGLSILLRSVIQELKVLTLGTRITFYLKWISLFLRIIFAFVEIIDIYRRIYSIYTMLSITLVVH